MAQLSRPLLIALASTVALVAVWLVALRPKPVPVSATPLAPTLAIPKAEQATATSDAANAKVQAATGGSAGSAAATPPAAAAAPTASRPATSSAAARQDAGERHDAAVARDIARGKVVVLLFWNPAAADDVATRSALRGIDLHGGKVVVRAVPIGRVAQYASVTRGLKIAQSPTTVVIGRKRHTRVIVGLTERLELTQAVGDALAGR
jgi:hypothetical protein